MLEAHPAMVDATGPHGIPLAAHAEHGGEAVSELLAERSRYAETG
jgi:hypothetical protein